MSKVCQQCLDWFQQACFDINKATIIFNKWQMLQIILTITKTFPTFCQLKLTKVKITLQQRSYMSTMCKLNKQLIKIFHQCRLKIEHSFLWIISDICYYGTDFYQCFLTDWLCYKGWLKFRLYLAAHWLDLCKISANRLLLVSEEGKSCFYRLLFQVTLPKSI